MLDLKKPILFAAIACLSAGMVGAKELPRRKPDEPQKTDRAEPACAYLGQGYVRAPGSDTCVKVGGSVRFDAAAGWSR